MMNCSAKAKNPSPIPSLSGQVIQYPGANTALRTSPPSAGRGIECNDQATLSNSVGKKCNRHPGGPPTPIERVSLSQRTKMRHGRASRLQCAEVIAASVPFSERAEES